MKAIGIKMVELQPMRASMALSTGYKIGNAHPDDMGYEVTYPDGYKSWTPKDVADAAYYPLSDNNDGTKILKEDVENFITDVDVTTIGEKTTVVNAHTRSGFDTVRHSSCVDPKNLKLNNILSIETYGNNSKVVNPKIPYKVYQCNSLARMQDKNGGNTLHVVLEDITPSADNDTFNREKIVVELNQFVNTWNPYVEPKEEIKDEVGEVHD